MGPVSRRFRIKATGFTTGKVLWAHVVHKGSKRHLKIGRLRGACHDLSTRLRLLPKNARFGKHRIQFDTFRRYRADRPVKTTYSGSALCGVAGEGRLRRLPRDRLRRLVQLTGELCGQRG